MKSIELTHVGDDYITIGYIDENGVATESEITGAVAIKAILVLGQALMKKSFLEIGDIDKLEF